MNRVLAFGSGLAIVLAACGSPAASPTAPSPTEAEASEAEASAAPDGGTVVFAHEGEPPCLNILTTGCPGGPLALIHPAIFTPAFVRTAHFTLEPKLLSGEPEISTDPFAVTYQIRDDAVWSDGVPITADDLVFTWETIVDPDSGVVLTEGYERITTADVIDEKTVRFEFDSVYAPFRELFDTVLPKHDLEGKDFTTVWADEVPVSSGPFKFERWDKGSQIVLTRNENYWGDGPHLDEVVIRFIPDPQTAVQALRGGEIDITDPQPQVDTIQELSSMTGVSFQSGLGNIFEQFRFNFARPPMDQQYVRQAIFQGVDREAITTSLVGSVVEGAEPLMNMYFPPGSEYFEPHWDIYPYDPEAAVQLLEENGCTRDTDDIFVCEGERLEFGYVSSSGNERRELMFQILQAQMQEIGISFRDEFAEGAIAYGERLPAGDWDIVNFGPGYFDPSHSHRNLQCGVVDFFLYCNPEVDALFEEGSSATDPDRRAAIYNQVDALVAQDVPWVPMFALARVVAYKDTLQGVVVNPNGFPTWNIEEWRWSE